MVGEATVGLLRMARRGRWPLCQHHLPDKGHRRMLHRGRRMVWWSGRATRLRAGQAGALAAGLPLPPPSAPAVAPGTVTIKACLPTCRSQFLSPWFFCLPPPSMLLRQAGGAGSAK